MGPWAAPGRDAVCRTRPRPHCAAARIQNSLLLTSGEAASVSNATFRPHLPARSPARRPPARDTAPAGAMSAEDYVSVRVEDDVEAVIIQNSEIEDAENGLSTQGCVSVEQNAQVNSDDHYMTQLAYGGEGLSVLSEPVVSQMSHSAGVQRDGQNPEEMEYVFLHKRRRLTPSLVRNSMIRSRETEYEDGGSVIYEYEPDYECGSVVSEASYTGDQQKTLMEVLNYCQAMYDAIQKLDKKFDLLHRKVSEMQHTRMKPLLLKPRPIGFTYRSSNHLSHGKIRVQKPMERESSLHISSPGQAGHSPSMRVRLQKSHLQANSAIKPVQQTLQLESQQPVLRQSPPLPTIVSTHSLHPPYTVANRIPDLPPQPNLVTTVMESTTNVAPSAVGSPMVSSVMPTPSETSLGRNTMMMNYRASPGSASISKELPSSSVSINPSFEYVGDPKRNVKVLGNYLMKARQKTKPKYAARYLVRVLFPKETLLCSIMGVSARGRRTLDPNKVAAVREFLAAHFPNYDLSEYGRDWKTCITNVNAMIRCLRCETKINPETTEGKEKPADTPDTSICVDLNYNGEDSEVNSQSSQKMTSSTTNRLQNTTWDKVPEMFHAPSSNKLQSLEPMEDILVKSNVYGNLERGMCPLDCNRINALRDFLQENYPSFDLKETGYDWKACVAAINSTIRSLRHDHKKAAIGVRKKVLATLPSSEKSPPQSPTSVKPYESDTINLTD
ncbi:BEN domain-containing protein 2 isoform X3 [Eretmochelys imbricata]